MFYRLVLTAIVTIALAGCGNSDNATPLMNEQDTATEQVNNDAPAAPGDDQPVATVTGRVVDAVNNTALAGVEITVTSNDTDTIATTDASGNYIVQNVPASDNASVSFSLAGYLTEGYGNLQLNSGGTLVLDAVNLVSDDNFGFGTISGTITNAVDGQGIAGLTLNFRRGINATSGNIIASTTTDNAGNYSVDGIEYGNVTCEIIGVGFNTSYATVLALGNIIQADQNTAISPNLNTGELRIVLTWGDQPRDLDSHLTGPQEATDDYFHVYYASRDATLANLDVDDTSSFGPETVTITRQINGLYRYSVYNFSNNGDGALSASQARVQVLGENGLLEDFFVPNGSGNLWTVFDLQGSTITPINTITQRESLSDHFPPIARKTPAASRQQDTRALFK